MNRSVSLVAAILAALSMSLVSAEEDPPVDAVHLRGAVWMLRTNTPIGNPSTVVAATEDATLVVDPNLLAASAPLREAIEKLGGGPIRWVTATHSHGDHSEGFEVFTEGTAIVPSAQRYQLATGRIVKGERPVAGAHLPELTFSSHTTIRLGSETVDLYDRPSGHTGGDLIAWFREARVLALGDQFFLDRFPIIDTGNGGSLDGYLDCLRWVLRTFPADTLVVPGHGNFPPEAARPASLGDVERNLRVLERSVEIVRLGLAEGLEADAIVEIGFPAEIAAFDTRPRYVSSEKWIRFLVSELTPGDPKTAPGLSEVVASLGRPESRAAFEGLVSRADCAGPTGSFTTDVVSLADGPARMIQRGSSETTNLLAVSNRVYERSIGAAEMDAAPEVMARFVRGHEVHRMLLELNERFSATGVADAAGCLGAETSDGRPASICIDAGTGRPRSVAFEISPEIGGGRVTIEVFDWKTVAGVNLPFAADFVHGEQRFTYRYHTVLPFRLAPGSPLPRDPTLLFDRLGDLAEVAALHEGVMAAHRAGDIDALIADQAANGTISGRGRLSASNRQDTRERLGPYLAATNFSRYEDTVVPLVAVATDGSLAWLACEMEAEGTQSTDNGEQPVAFGFSWVEMLAREHGRWVLIGNASSQRP